MVGPATKRAAAAHLRAKMGLSERRACSIVGADRTMVRYRSRRPPDAELRARLRELANERRRFGYRRLFVLLRRQGERSGINRIHRLYMLSRGRFQRWSEMHVAALEPFRPHMTPENRALFDLFCESRKRGFFGRQAGFLKSGVYRQTFLDDLGLIVAVWARKI